MADVVFVNKIDSSSAEQLRELMADVAIANPTAAVVRAASPVSLAAGPPVTGQTVLVVEDGPTITHGGMPSGAGTVAAQRAGARIQVDPRRWAVGSIAESLKSFRRYPHIGSVLERCGTPRPAARARRDNRRGRVRSGGRRHAGRPRPVDPLPAPDPPDQLRASGDRRADPRGSARANHHQGSGRVTANAFGCL